MTVKERKKQASIIVNKHMGERDALEDIMKRDGEKGDIYNGTSSELTVIIYRHDLSF